MKENETAQNDSILPTEFALGFDPAKSADRDVRACFKDGLGKALWCALRYQRCVGENFNWKVAQLAEMLRRRKKHGTLTEMSLRSEFWILQHGGEVFGSTEDIDAYARELLPYLLGEKQFTYKQTAKK